MTISVYVLCVPMYASVYVCVRTIKYFCMKKNVCMYMYLTVCDCPCMSVCVCVCVNEWHSEVQCRC